MLALALVAFVVWSARTQSNYSATIISLTPGLIALMLASISVSNAQKKVKEIADEADKATKALAKEVKFLDEVKCAGITGFRLRDSTESSFWKEFLQHSEHELVLSGSTLHRWKLFDMQEDQFFVRTLRRMIKEKNRTFRLRFVLELKDKATNKELTMHRYLRQHVGFLGEKKIDAVLEIYNGVLPFFYCENDHEIIVGPYFQKVDALHKEIFIIQIDKTTPYGSLLKEEFNACLRDMNRLSWNGFLSRSAASDSKEATAHDQAETNQDVSG